MSTARPSQRATRRRNGSRVRVEAVIDVDLNSSPLEHLVPVGNSSSAWPFRSLGSSESRNRPIDLEATEDEVVPLYSARRSPQSRRLSRDRSNQSIIILDEELDTSSIPGSENAVENLTVTSSVNINHKRGRAVTRTVINCEIYPVEDNENTKKKKSKKPMPESPKENPTFSCPICMNPLVEASSTICGHVFCHGCITKSIQVQKKCPTCRKNLKMNNFHRVYLPS